MAKQAVVAVQTEKGGEFVQAKLVSFERGWATVKLGDGSTKKVRPSAIEGGIPEKTPRKASKRENGATGSVISADIKAAYEKGKTEAGKKFVDNGDETAEELRGLPLEKVYSRAAKACKVTVGELEKAYGHLNVGMQRMNLGNKIRAAARALEAADAE